jgi:hypothetical protein
MKTEKIFQYSSRMAFGPCATYFAIEKRGKNYYRIDGTPQNPSKAIKIDISEKEIEQIKSLVNKDCDDANYIKHVMLR